MAVTGTMAVKNEAFGNAVEILNRPPYEGVPMTLNDEVFESADVVKAGSVITSEGKIAESGTGAAGILIWDVYKDRPQGTILKKAYVNLNRIKESLGDDAYETQYGVSESNLAAIQSALPMIVFEEKPASGE